MIRIPSLCVGVLLGAQLLAAAAADDVATEIGRTDRTVESPVRSDERSSGNEAWRALCSVN